mmetsp:Transcript_26639/g.62572  ORF Transcript_26639/g.62572 Transcript_26639/m.62572 type:complete len:150 (+) Transcript_26639:30-479(+)
MSSAYCKSYTDAYRSCLKDCRDSGRSKTASKICKPLAIKLDSCREEWRKKYPVEPKPISDVSSHEAGENKTHDQYNVSKLERPKDGFDGSRILPHPKCRPLSCDVQRCIKWKKGDQSKCQSEIKALQSCMDSTTGTIVNATDGDKVWSV